MQKAIDMCLALTVLVACTTWLSAQQAPRKSTVAQRITATEQEKPLVLTEAIPLEGVKGRFDHFASGGGRLFVAALGNNSVGVINTGGRTLDHMITGVPDPQGVAF